MNSMIFVKIGQDLAAARRQTGHGFVAKEASTDVAGIFRNQAPPAIGRCHWSPRFFGVSGGRLLERRANFKVVELAGTFLQFAVAHDTVADGYCNIAKL